MFPFEQFYLRVCFQVIKLTPVMHITPIGLLFLCLRTVEMIGCKSDSKLQIFDLLCQANILRVSVLACHDSVPLHESLRMVHEVIPEQGRYHTESIESGRIQTLCLVGRTLHPCPLPNHQGWASRSPLPFKAWSPWLPLVYSPAESDVPGVDRTLVYWRESCCFDQGWQNVHKLNHLVSHLLIHTNWDQCC